MAKKRAPFGQKLHPEDLWQRLRRRTESSGLPTGPGSEITTGLPKTPPAGTARELPTEPGPEIRSPLDTRKRPLG